MVESVHRLLLALVDWSYIEQLSTLEQAQVVDASKKPQTERYRLTEEALIALSGIRRSQSANGVEVDIRTVRKSNLQSSRGLETLGRVSVCDTVGSYQIVSLLGTGVLGGVMKSSTIRVVSGRSH